MAKHIMYVTAVQEGGGPGQNCAFGEGFDDIVLSKEAHQCSVALFPELQGSHPSSEPRG